MTTPPPRWAEELVAALLPHARAFNAAVGTALITLNRRLEEARTMTNTAQLAADRIRERVLTAPIVVETLADKAALVARYQPGAEWTIGVDPDAGATWVLRWDRLELVVGDLDDLELARFVVAERLRAVRFLRRLVVDTATELGLDPRPFRQPATIVVNAGLTRCPACACNVVARTHRPGSEECHADREERLISIAS